MQFAYADPVNGFASTMIPSKIGIPVLVFTLCLLQRAVASSVFENLDLVAVWRYGNRTVFFINRNGEFAPNSPGSDKFIADGYFGKGIPLRIYNLGTQQPMNYVLKHWYYDQYASESERWSLMTEITETITTQALDQSVDEGSILLGLPTLTPPVSLGEHLVEYRIDQGGRTTTFNLSVGVLEHDEKGPPLHPPGVILTMPRSGSHWLMYMIETMTRSPVIGDGVKGGLLTAAAFFPHGVRGDNPYDRRSSLRWTHNEKDSNLVQTEVLIFLIRHPIELLLRHTGREGALGRSRVIGLFVRNFKVFSEHPGPKMMLRFEDITSTDTERLQSVPDPHTKLMCPSIPVNPCIVLRHRYEYTSSVQLLVSLLEILGMVDPETSVSHFLKDLDVHKAKSREGYSGPHRQPVFSNGNHTFYKDEASRERPETLEEIRSEIREESSGTLKYICTNFYQDPGGGRTC